MEGEEFYGAAYKGTKQFTQKEVKTANATGFGAAADDYMERGIDLNEQLVHNKPATYFFRMKGDAMQDAGIFDGDILIVDRSLKLANGKITPPLTPTAALCMWPLVGDAMVCVTASVNIFVVVLNVSVASPVAVEALAGTSCAPVNVALKVTLGLGGVSSSLSHELIPNKRVETANNLIIIFITHFLVIKKKLLSGG
jgi:hypothetical protein